MKVYIPFNEDYFEFTEDTALPMADRDYEFKIKGMTFGNHSSDKSMADCIWLPTLAKDVFLFPKGLIIKVYPRTLIKDNYRDSRFYTGYYAEVRIPRQNLDGVIWNGGKFFIERVELGAVEFNLVEKP